MLRLPRAAGPILGIGLLLAACAPQAAAEPVHPLRVQGVPHRPKRR